MVRRYPLVVVPFRAHQRGELTLIVRGENERDESRDDSPRPVSRP